MNRKLMIILAGGLALAASATACTVTEGDPDGIGGFGGGIGGGGVGADGGAGGGTGGEGTGAAPTCVHCAEYFTSQVDACPESQSLVDDVLSCACTRGICDAACESVCNAGGGTIDTDCNSCLQDAFAGTCSDQFGACSLDIGD